MNLAAMFSAAGPTTQTPGPIAGTVKDGPDADGLILIEWQADAAVDTDAADGYERVRWIGHPPAVGDDALLIIDSRGDPWAATWTATPQIVNLFAYGAKGDGIANDGPAIQRALNRAGELVAGSPGVTVYVPAGRFRYTTALVVPEGVSIRGEGRASVLKPEGCDALVFDTSDYIGPQVFEGFYIEGDGYTYTAVRALGDADAGRVQGVTFRDVLISTFKTAFHLRSTHGWHLQHVTGMNLWEPVVIAGQTILFTMDGGCEFSRDNATGSGLSKGLQIMTAADYNPGGTTEKGAEGIRVRDTTLFGFGIPIDHVHALDTVYDGLTLGMVGNTALQITNTPGGLRFRDSWIGYDNGAVYGVHAVPLGAANDSTIIIEGVHGAVESGKTTDANSIGCAIDSNQSNVTVRDNTWTGNRLHDVRLNFAGKCALSDNKCLSVTSGASIQLVAFPGGPYYVQRNAVATNVFEHASNTGAVYVDQPRTASQVANASPFIDVADGVYKFKDAGGTVHALY